MNDPETITANQDERMIPIWSIVLAFIAFIAVEYYFWMVAPAYRHHRPPSLGLRIYFNISWGVMAALYFLMVGYVSRDAPRRGMLVRFWVVICFVIPAGIGAVLYFLLRSPIVSICPSCGTHVLDDFHFCPQCCYQLTASCGNCFHAVRPSDQFCAQCGHELADDARPARLGLPD